MLAYGVLAAEGGEEGAHVALEILRLGIHAGLPIGYVVWTAVIVGVAIWLGGLFNQG